MTKHKQRKRQPKRVRATAVPRPTPQAPSAFDRTPEKDALHRALTDPVEAPPTDWMGLYYAVVDQRDAALTALNDRNNIGIAIVRMHEQAKTLQATLKRVLAAAKLLKHPAWKQTRRRGRTA